MGRVDYAFIRLDAAKTYREDVMEALGGMLDCAAWNGIGGADVSSAFVACGLAHEFERCNPVYVAGKSALELLGLLEPWLDCSMQDATCGTGTSPDYWLGHSLGYFQTETGWSYRSVFEAVSYEELREMYWPLHEAPETKFVSVLSERLENVASPTRLARLRINSGLSQLELAERAGVGLRSIQMYEQRNKDINRAQAQAVYALSCALNCSMEALLER